MTAKKAKKSVKKNAQLGDATQEALENATIASCQKKLNELQNQYAAGTYVDNDPIAHLGKEVKIAHWIRSLLNQTIN